MSSPSTRLTTSTKLTRARSSKSALAISDENVFVFDWDDTLLCSTWLTKQGLKLDSKTIPEEFREQLERLSSSVCEIIGRCTKKGQVHICTNAESGWVELSAEKFMPKVVPLLPLCRVLSARSTFEAYYPNNPAEWKMAAFNHVLKSFLKASATRSIRVPAHPPTQIYRNILSIGDSPHDRSALLGTAKKLKISAMAHTFVKNVKFIERPTADQLLNQLDCICDCMNDLTSHKGNLDLMLTAQVVV